jgi:hypothetical protein
MRFTDKFGRKIETRSGEDAGIKENIPGVVLYINGQYVTVYEISQYSPENVAAAEGCLFEAYGIEF